MKKRFAASAMILAMSAATVLSPLTAFAEAEEQELNIAIFQGGYGDAYWNQMVELFEASHEGVKVNMTISPTIGDIIRPQIVAGNAPDFICLNDGAEDGVILSLIKEHALLNLDDVFDGENYAGTGTLRDDITDGILSSTKCAPYGDDEIYLAPFSSGPQGLIYNKTAIEEITGEEFKPEDYVTLDEFKPLLEKLKEGGMESPVILNSEDWSIGQHFLQYIYKMHTGKAEDALAFLDEVRQGKANFEDDAVFNALYDTMDVLIDNNINKADPLAADYDLNASYLAEGESAFWLNGSWAWPDTKEYVDGSMSYGIMPYPVNGDFTSAGQLNANATKFIAIDNVKATPEQQEAAKDFLNWLVYDEEGQDLIVNKCNLVPAFSNIKLDMTNDFNKSVKKYVDEGKVNAYVPIPSDHRSTLAAYMQKYLAGELDRTELAGYLDDYWKNH